MEYSCNCSPDLSGQIAKLKGMKSFNLPALESCPYKTPACIKYCYATKNNFTRYNVKSLYQRNLVAARCKCFVSRMIKLLNRHTRTRVIRIHGSGDFFSRIYFSKWLQVVRVFPGKQFYGYTRNWTVDIGDLPRNLRIYYSVDYSSTKLNPTAKYYAETLDVHKDYTYHMEAYDTGRICKSDLCMDCRYCWEKEGDVYFPQKYKGHAVPMELI